MVKSILALSAILASGVALAAPESLSKVNTDSGEILLEVVATGVSTTKITKVSTFCDLRATASDRAEAATALKKAQQDLANGMRSAKLSTVILDFAAPSKTNGDQYYYGNAAAV